MVDQLPSIFDQYKSYINFYLKSGLDQKADSQLSGFKNNLYNILSYGMGWTDKSGNPVNIPGGKLLRPTLCLFATEASGGKTDKAIKLLSLWNTFITFHYFMMTFRTKTRLGITGRRFGSFGVSLRQLLPEMY